MFRKPLKIVRHSNPANARRAADAKRASSAVRGYDRRWQEYRSGFLTEYPLCVACLAPTRDAQTVDHIIPVATVRPDAGSPADQSAGQADPLFWARWNHQPLCLRHHATKSRLHDARLHADRTQLERTVQQWMAEGETDDDRIRQRLLTLVQIWPEWLDHGAP